VKKADLYCCFIERGLSLTEEGGRFSYIVPKSWTSLESFTKLRKYILANGRVDKLTRLPKKVFADATIETCIVVVQKQQSPTGKAKHEVIRERLSATGGITCERTIKQGDIATGYQQNFQLEVTEATYEILGKVKKAGKPLKDMASFVYGFKTADDEKFISATKDHPESKLFVRSADIGRYYHNRPSEYVWYVPAKMKRNRSTARPGEEARFQSEKILVSRMGKQELACTYDPGGLYVKDAMLLLPKNGKQSLKYVTAILNSELMRLYYKEYFITIDVLKNAILSLPIVPIDFTDRAHVRLHSALVSLVDRMLALQKRLHSAVSDTDRKSTARGIETTDREIDRLVYQLYGLSSHEVLAVRKALA
jgi:hypothetical protein